MTRTFNLLKKKQITILIKDLNDNLPKIEMVGFSSNLKASQNTALMYTISENEMGILYFGDYIDSITQANRRGLIAYDSDLDENATFSLQFIEQLDDQLERSYSLSKTDLAGHFRIITWYRSHIAFKLRLA
jgi:hypothetical protein